MEKQSMFTNTQVATSRIIYTPSVFARTTLLYLQETGSLQALQQHTAKRDHLQSYLFFTVLSGSGRLTYGKKSYTLKQGDCVFIDCMKPYTHCPDAGNLWMLKWVHLNGIAMRGVYEKYVERSGRPVFHPQQDTFVRQIDRIYTTAAKDSHIRDMELNSLLSELLTLLMRETVYEIEKQPTDETNKAEQLLAIKVFIDQHYTEKITLDSLSAQFFIEKTYLSRSFKEQNGITIINYINRVRVMRAKEILRFTSKSVDDVALAIGIEDRSYFSRLFHRTEGISPSEYRKQW